MAESCHFNFKSTFKGNESKIHFKNNLFLSLIYFLIILKNNKKFKFKRFFNEMQMKSNRNEFSSTYPRTAISILNLVPWSRAVNQARIQGSATVA